MKNLLFVLLSVMYLSCNKSNSNVNNTEIKKSLLGIDKVVVKIYGLKDTSFVGADRVKYISDIFFSEKITNSNCFVSNNVEGSEFNKTGEVIFYTGETIKFQFHFTLNEGWQYEMHKKQYFDKCFSYGMDMFLTDLIYELERSL